MTTSGVLLPQSLSRLDHQRSSGRYDRIRVLICIDLSEVSEAMNEAATRAGRKKGLRSEEGTIITKKF